MPASVSLSHLSWSTPDGTPLLSDLTLAFGPERTGLVGRNGCGKTTLLRLIAGDLVPAAGEVHVAGRCATLRQDVCPRPGASLANLFGVTDALDLLDRAEAGRAGMDDLARADWTLPARIEAALARCGLSADPRTPLAALSGGQRTRAGLAALIFDAPHVLLLDEPTNNLDRAGRTAVIELLRGWRSCAVVVSHDRELLEEMDAIVELSPQGATRFGGPYSAYRARKEIERAAAERDLADAEKESDLLRQRARQAEERKARTDRMGRKARARGDQPKILMDAAKERSESSGGANARLRAARAQAADEHLAAARDRIELVQPLRMDVPSTGLPRGRTVLELRDLTGGYDLAAPVIRNLSLAVTGPERIAITGPNGCGKSTLIALITGALAPLSGTVDLSVPFALMDQSLGLLDPSLTLRENFRALNPDADETACRAALARFRFRADDALRTAGSLSGGERLRAGLACTMGRAQPPQLLILDEPTNHLDLDGLEALEGALAAYDGALLLVSHDAAFLDRIALTRRLELAA